MPKFHEVRHREYMRRFVNIGCKTILDKIIKNFALDKNRALLPVNLCVKLLPVLTNNIYFCGALKNDVVDDIIIIDENLIIQGITKKIVASLKSKDFYNILQIPFYVICRKFINFSKQFLIRKKINIVRDNRPIQTSILDNSEIINTKQNLPQNENERSEDKNIFYFDKEAEVNESMEIEFDITIPNLIKEYLLKKDNIVIMQKEIIIPHFSSNRTSNSNQKNRNNNSMQDSFDKSIVGELFDKS